MHNRINSYTAYRIIIRKRLNAGTVPANKEYAAGTLSNVRRCWLAMPPVAGFLEMFVACHTIEKKTKV